MTVVLFAFLAILAALATAGMAALLMTVLDYCAHRLRSASDPDKETPPKGWDRIALTNGRKVVLSDPCGRIVVRRQP